MAAAIVIVWLVATLLWWAFAFMPLPSRPPEWLESARHACFGPLDTGWPSAAGWLLLVMAPGTFLASIVAVWGAELGPALRRVARSRAGRAALAALAAVLVVEGTWVTAKLRTARTLEAWTPTSADAAVDLPPDYPRRTAPAPDFTLIDQHGARVALSQFRGRPVVLTFVFAHCETMCPLLVQALKRGAPDADVLLVTLDPWRDTPGALPGLARRWALPARFHALSARRVDDVLAVVRAYDVPFERNAVSGDIAHPGVVFLIDAAGRLAYTFNNPPAAWIRDALPRLA